MQEKHVSQILFYKSATIPPIILSLFCKKYIESRVLRIVVRENRATASRMYRSHNEFIGRPLGTMYEYTYINVIIQVPKGKINTFCEKR